MAFDYTIHVPKEMPSGPALIEYSHYLIAFEPTSKTDAIIMSALSQGLAGVGRQEYPDQEELWCKLEQNICQSTHDRACAGLLQWAHQGLSSK